MLTEIFTKELINEIL